jgi:hypothetical protein
MAERAWTSVEMVIFTTKLWPGFTVFVVGDMLILAPGLAEPFPDGTRTTQVAASIIRTIKILSLFI